MSIIKGAQVAEAVSAETKKSRGNILATTLLSGSCRKDTPVLEYSAGYMVHMSSNILRKS